MTTSSPFDPRATAVPVLRYLVAVAEHRHFGKAATAARVTQPTLSTIISQWEKRMGCVVFERDPRGVRVTPAGELVIAAARQALGAIEAVELAAKTAKPPFFGRLRLGVIPTVGPYALPFISAALRRSFPELEAPIREGTTSELTAGLDAGHLDVALLALLPGMAERYTAEALYDEPFLVALPRGHVLGDKAELTAVDLAGERLLLLDEGHCLREQALSVCQRDSASAAGPDYRATSLETLRQIVASGAGITLLPALAVQPDDRRITIRPLADEAQRTIGLLWRSNDPRAQAYHLLLPAIRRHLPRELVRAR